MDGEKMVQTEHAAQNAAKWDVRSIDFDKKRFNYFRFFQRKVVDAIGLQPNDTFLDIGCGTGWAVCYASLFTEGAGKCYGIDISPMMIAKAIENSHVLANFGEKVQFEVADSEKLPFDANFFNYIICTNSFHHYLHPLTVLSEIYRVLKPSGRLLILDLCSDSFIIRHVNRRAQRKEKEHVNFYSMQEIKHLFAEVNLQFMRSKWVLYPLKLYVAAKP